MWREFKIAQPRILGARSTQWCTACAPWVSFISTGCLAWPISRYGPRLARQPCGTPALSRAPMKQTAGPPSRALSMPIRSPLACGRSWPSAARGRAVPATFCGRAAVATVMAPRGTVPAGRKTPARLLAACVARRRSCGHWASTLPSAGKAGPEAGSLEYEQLGKIPSDQPAPRPAGDVCDDDSRSDLVGRYPMGPACVTTADDADGADANAGLHFG